MAIASKVFQPRLGLIFPRHLLSYNRSALRTFAPHQVIGAPFVRPFSTTISRGNIFVVRHARRFKEGDIVSSKHSSRPGLVISSDLVIQKTDHVVFANISGNVAKVYPFEAFIQASARNGLDKDSKVMTNHLFTLPKKVVLDPLRSKRLGSIDSADQEKVDQGLRVCLSSLSLKDKPLFSRGSVVETKNDHGDVVYGVIISNDIGNMESRIVILSPTKDDEAQNDLFQLEVEVKNEKTSVVKTMRVDCNEIDSASQSGLKVIGKVSENDLRHIESKVLLGLSLLK